MATYCVLTTETTDWGEPADRFKTRAEADHVYDSLRERGHFVRLVRWIKGTPEELERTKGTSGPRS